MKTLLNLITAEMEQAFQAADYDPSYAKVTLSIDRIFASTSVMVQWQPQKLIKRRRS